MASWWFWLGIIAFFGLATNVTAQSADLEALAAAYPACSLECMVEYIPQSSCMTTDGLNQTCVCSNEALNLNVTICAQKACTVKELLSMFPLRMGPTYTDKDDSNYECVLGSMSTTSARP